MWIAQIYAQFISVTRPKNARTAKQEKRSHNNKAIDVCSTIETFLEGPRFSARKTLHTHTHKHSHYSCAHTHTHSISVVRSLFLCGQSAETDGSDSEHKLFGGGEKYGYVGPSDGCRRLIVRAPRVRAITRIVQTIFLWFIFLISRRRVDVCVCVFVTLDVCSCYENTDEYLALLPFHVLFVCG